MEMYFSIDALALLGDKAWRLQADKITWRPCKLGEPLQADDARLTDANEVSSWVNVRLQKDDEFGLKAKGKAGMFDFLMRGIFAHVILHRLSTAPVPIKDLMVQTIRHAEVGTPWLMYLDLGGNFRMLKSEESKIIGNPSIAVRGEIASSAAFIGEEAALNTTLIDTLYHQFVAGWLEHLTTSRLSVFVPDTEDIRPLDECLEKIKAWEHE